MQKDDFKLILPCPTRKDEQCKCPREMRNHFPFEWMKKNRDILKDVLYKDNPPNKASLDTPGFLPLKYQQPM